MRPYYDAAIAFMVPLRLGGGTRLKIVEAMAMGLPVVSTSVGAEGLDIHPGQDILIADDASSFATEVLRLFADAELRARLSEGGRRLAARYDWKELMRPFADLVENDRNADRSRGTLMRIVRLINLYPPYIVGGYEMLTRDIVQELTTRGHDVHVLTRAASNLMGARISTRSSITTLKTRTLSSAVDGS